MIDQKNKEKNYKVSISHLKYSYVGVIFICIIQFVYFSAL